MLLCVIYVAYQRGHFGLSYGNFCVSWLGFFAVFFGLLTVICPSIQLENIRKRQFNHETFIISTIAITRGGVDDPIYR